MTMLQKGSDTPWGQAQQVDVIADGIEFVSTASHGGYLLSEERFEKMPEGVYRQTWAGGRWYEEDCDAGKVIVSFPEHFKPEYVEQAREFLKSYLAWKGKQ